MSRKNVEQTILENFGKELKELLIEFYCDKEMSQKDIARTLNLSTGFISQKFKEYNIKQRPFGHWAIGREMSEEHKKKLIQINKGKKISEEHKKKLSESMKGKPSARKGVGLAQEVKEKYGIELEEYLRELYWDEGLSQLEICEKIGVATGYMSRLFKRFDIKKRPNGYWLLNSGEVIAKVKIGSEEHNVTGKWVNKTGYVVLVIKSHPNTDVNGCIFEHRVVVEQHLGRYLLEEEIIHHINEVKNDNRIENLQVTNRAEHTIHHHKGSKRNEEVKKRISSKAKERLKDKKNHPSYKDIDKELISLIEQGYKPTEIAKKLNITRKTIYNKMDYLGLKEMYINAQ